MEFSRLRVSGFKSFCDPVELEIGSGLTGIVGPNGCGKSNIVEALRWVMGESSARGLRGSEMNDVIFAGSALRSAYDIAEVSLLVKKPVSVPSPTAGKQAVAGGEDTTVEGAPGLAEAGAPFELQELEIARRISRSAGSAYRINGREVRARDVHLVFADVGAGARSPAIISQGQVGFVVEAKPEERRRLLEDAAGIGGLHSRRREAELKLAATERNLERVTDRIAGQDERLVELRRQAKQAERYRKLQEQIRELEAMVTLARLKEAREALETTRVRHEELTREHARGQHAASEAEKARGVAEKALPARREAVSLASALAVRAEERLSSVEAGRQQHERETAMLAEQVEELRQRLDSYRRDAERAETMLTERDLEATAAGEEMTQVGARLAELRDIEPALTRQSGEDSLRLQEMERELATAEARHESLARQLAGLRARRADVAQELERLVAVDDDALVEVAGRRLAEARAEHEAASRTRRQAMERAEALAVQQKELGSRVESGREQLASAVSARQEVDVELRQARQRHEARSDQLARLDREGQRVGRRIEAIEREFSALALEARGETHKRLSAQCATLKAQLDDREEAERRLTAACEAAVEGREIAVARVGEAERQLERSLAEDAALRSLQSDDDGHPVIDSFDVPEAWGRALAAALGDDLLLRVENGDSSGGFWRHLDPELPTLALPAGVEPLSGHLDVPEILRRRLQSVGVCPDSETASRLQPGLAQGQRLVTQDGGLWRWDGLVRLPGEEDPGELRVMQRRRLAVLAAGMPALRQALMEAQAHGAESRATLHRLEGELAEVRAEHRRLEMEFRTQTVKRDQLTREIEVGGASRARLVEERDALQREQAVLDDERQKLGEEDPQLLKTIEARYQGAADTVRHFERDFASQRDRLASVEGRLETARKEADKEGGRETELLEAVTRAEITFERRRGEAEVRKAHRSTASTTLTRDAEKLDAEIDAVGGELSAIEMQLTGLREDRDAHAARLDARRNELETVRQEAARHAARLSALEQRIASLKAEHARLIESRENAVRSREPLVARLSQARDKLERHRAESGPAARHAEIVAELQRLTAALAGEQEALAAAEGLLARCTEASRQAEARLAACHEAMALAGAERQRLQDGVDAALAHARARLNKPVDDLLGQETISEMLADADVPAMEERLQRLVTSRERAGPVNLRAAIEADEREAELAGLRREEEDLRHAVDRLKSGISTLNREARERLNEVFVKVDDHFRRLFGKLFQGGKAHLRLTHLDDPLNCGLELEAMPPGKKLQNISLLSGGEKSLTALALIFAFFLSEPSPLCVLDEVDAALDDANVERFVLLMEEIARETRTRFVVVTHHPFTMARMDRLFGVTMIERGVSRLVSVALDEAVEIGSRA
ncbi:MAG: AAA family ATPase [Geminicoccaceae bacterium]|nr:AAA family ATPase [Geminicoccaceae bacterium]